MLKQNAISRICRKTYVEEKNVKDITSSRTQRL